MADAASSRQPLLTSMFASRIGAAVTSGISISVGPANCAGARTRTLGLVAPSDTRPKRSQYRA